MTIARRLAADVLIVAAGLPLIALADSNAPANREVTDATVIVMRGDEARILPGRRENGVIVVRPAPGSFMRETIRLAREAEARDERAARNEAREANLRLIGALEAVENAADAVARQKSTYLYYVVSPPAVRHTTDPGTGKPRQRVAPTVPRGNQVAIPDRGA